jgi:hypothetical protein
VTEPNDKPSRVATSLGKPKRNLKWSLLILAGMCVIAVGIYFGVTRVFVDQTFSLSGTLTLYSDDSPSVGQVECRGTGGYQDIGQGTSVSISDEAGVLLAKGNLDRGSQYPGFCIFAFRVADVPEGKSFYRVEVAQRGETSYTESEARARISLQLGDPAATTPVPTTSIPPLLLSPADTPTLSSFGPGTYKVPDEMPYGIYTSSNAPDAWPGCMWSTWTDDGKPIDMYNMTFEDGGKFVAQVLSPAIATFQGSEGCTEWTRVGSG